MEESPDIIWLRSEKPTRGPKPGYSRAQIVEAAIRVADHEGLDAASMRRVAKEIGAGTMSLYRYVPRREDLIDLMVDTVYGELELPGRPSGDWRADLALFAHRLRTLTLRHPWLVRPPDTLRVMGPNMLRALEFSLGALDGRGLSIDEMMVLFGILRGYVDGFTREEVFWAEEMRRTGMTSEQWMRRTSPYINRIIASGDYPVFTKIIVEARQPHMDPDARFEYGLERVLDTIAATLAAAPADRPASTAPRH